MILAYTDDKSQVFLVYLRQFSCFFVIITLFTSYIMLKWQIYTNK